jgi:hypothetical protein
MKTYAYIPLHYGAEYLAESIKSIEPLVDKILIFYSSVPTFGTNTNAKCPESESQLYEIASKASSKVQWMRIDASGEGKHRDMHKHYIDDCDVMITTDADEVWWTEKLESAIEVAYNDKQNNRFGVSGKIDLWRSFDYQMIDWFCPVRIMTHGRNNQTNIECPYLHFGYAQSMSIIEYKMKIHGHVNEVIKLHGSVDNYLNKVRNWQPQNENTYHPASRDIWKKAEHYDKNLMPALMKSHPYWGKELIQ